MHAESPRFAPMPYDPERVRATAEWVIGEGLVVVAEQVSAPLGLTRDGDPMPLRADVVGMAAASPCYRFFNTDAYAADLVVYVHPDHRRGRLAAGLIKALEAAVLAKIGPCEMVLGATTGVETEAVTRLYGRLGYRVIGVVTAKDLQAEA